MILLLLSLLACATADSPAAPAAEIPASTTPAAKKSTERPKLDIPAPADVAAPPADAVVTASGLASKVVTAGTGTEHPTAKDKVTVHYTGWTTDGAAFDSSSKRGKPATFGLGQVIAGWTEGVQLMVVGEKTRFWIPAEQAYGETPKRPGAPSGDLTFDIELKEIKDASEMPTRGQRPTKTLQLKAPPAEKKE